MEIIDTHVHIWPVGTEPPRVGSPYTGPADPQSLIAEMDRAGVAAAFLITPRSMGTDNSYAVAAYRAHPNRFPVVVGTVDHHHPVPEAARLAREAATGELHGVRFHPCFDPDLDLGAPALGPVWDACATAGLPIAIHADPAQYGQIEALAAARPDLVLLIDHLGRFPLQEGAGSPAFDELLALGRHQQVHLKLSSVPWLLRAAGSSEALLPFYQAALGSYGPDRLIWGADWPVLCGVGWSYTETVAHGLALPLEGQARTAFLAGNARRLYRLA